MTSEELKKLIKTGENGVVEFKRGRGGVPGDFWPSYSAFANTDGGGKKTSTKSAKTSTKKTSSKSAKTRGKDWGLKDEDLVVLRLTSNQVVVAMRENPKITREELATQLKVSLRGIEWQVAKLQKDKVIRRVGGRKFGSWEVLI